MKGRVPSAPPLQIVLEIVRAGPADSRPELAFHELGQRAYQVRIGSSFAPAMLDWDTELLADLASLRQSRDEGEVLHRLGLRLRRFLRDTDWPRHEADLLAALARKDAVHIVVSADADEMYALPWELLVLDSSGQHIGELAGVLVRYAWPRSRAPTTSTSTAAGSILLAWSAAAGLVPAAEHVHALRRTCGRRSPIFDERHDVIPHVSWGRLQDALQAAAAHGRPVRVLHILCHGVRQGGNMCLAWNDDDGDGRAIIDGHRLRQLLAEHASDLRLVVLCACDSSHEALLGTHLGSLARNLHRIGIETVIGSAVPLSSRASITFTERFYRALVAQQGSPAQAFVIARQGLARHVSTLDWLALRFYCRPGEATSALPLPRPGTVWMGLRLRQFLLALVVAGACAVAVALDRRFPADLAGCAGMGDVDMRMVPPAADEPGNHRLLEIGSDAASPGSDAGASGNVAPSDNGESTGGPARLRRAGAGSLRRHRVVVFFPSFMGAPEILVDGGPAEVLERTLTSSTIRTYAGSQRITVRARYHPPCERLVAIQRDGQPVTPCPQ
jgi:hypothetical protein